MAAPPLKPGSLTVQTNPEPGRAKTRRSRWHSLTWWSGHHFRRRDDGEFADGDNGGWGRSSVQRTSKKSHREREREIERDNHAAARHAQVLREEAAEAHVKGSRERADFYGSEHGNGGRDAERLIRGGGTAARERYEADQRAAWLYKPRGRAAKKG